MRNYVFVPDLPRIRSQSSAFSSAFSALWPAFGVFCGISDQNKFSIAIHLILCFMALLANAFVFVVSCPPYFNTTDLPILNMDQVVLAHLGIEIFLSTLLCKQWFLSFIFRSLFQSSISVICFIVSIFSTNNYLALVVQSPFGRPHTRSPSDLGTSTGTSIGTS